MMPFWRKKEINVCAEQLNSVSGTFTAVSREVSNSVYCQYLHPPPITGQGHW
ncbi:hypothetical protein F385_689 [Pantoea agglomerans 299R]|nr:hypothetical protein F385_689 [Pantoea agglomerans 299R]